MSVAVATPHKARVRLTWRCGVFETTARADRREADCVGKAVPREVAHYKRLLEVRLDHTV
jgi:hypothetical protein